MRKLLPLILALVCLTLPAAAQDDDRSLIVGFLEDNLSDAGRDIRLEGFEGALSSQATLDRLTIGDADGIWLELEKAELAWTRSALLRGRLEIERLAAEAITLHRLPGGDQLSPDDTEAREFNLPDLPVSINIGKLEVKAVSIGEPVFGDAAEFQIEGSIALSGGEGTAKLAIERRDEPAELSLETSFDNSSRQLNIDLALSEAKNGLLSRVIGLPGQPAIAFSLTGRGPLDDFSADLALASDGADRLTGTIRTSLNSEAEARQFGADLSGDLRPLFQPDLRPFFGQSTALTLLTTREGDGALSVSRFSLESAAMSLRGDAQIAASGRPERVSIQGQLGGGDEATRLPLSGPPTQLQSAQLNVSYDQAEGEAWQADIVVERLQNGPLVVEQTEFTARGTLSREAPLALDANLSMALSGLSHKDENLARTLGSRANAKARLSWREGQPLSILALSAEAGDVSLTGAGEIGNNDASVFPVSATLRLDAPRLERFAPLADIPLTGAAGMTVIGNADLLTGAFDGAVFAETTDLGLGNSMLDPLIAGDGRLRLSALRDANGLAFDRLDLVTPQAEILALGRLNGKSGTMKLNANIQEISVTALPLTGPARLETAIEWQEGAPLRLANLQAQIADSTLTASGTLDPTQKSLPVSGKAQVKARDLSRFARLTRRALRGSAILALEGKGSLRDRTFEVSTEAEAQGLRTSVPSVDALLTGGPLSLSGRVAKGDGPVDLRQLSLNTAGLTLRAVGQGAGAPINMTARISDLARLTPGFPGPLSANGTVQFLEDWGQRLAINLTAEGPGGTQANVSGNIEDYGQALDISANGNAPLGLANRFIAPRAVQGTARYDLRINGAAQLASVSGEISTNGARATLPTHGVVIQNITGRAALASGQATLQVQGQSRAGGTLRVDGPIRLTPPFPADLTIALNGLRITDPDLYKTSATGQMTLTGPLAGGASLGGALTLDETNIRVPSSSPVNTQGLRGVRHVNDSAAARTTRARAGLDADAAQSDRASTAIALDLVINAPNRIFVRGRGLDAELGGRLQLLGSSANITPSGQISLIRGRFDILGKRLDLTEGQITLRGALDPYLRFVAETDAGEITAQVIMEGLASAPEVSFTSTPELPQEEVVARLIFGRGLDKISGFQAAQLASAIATLRGGGPGLLGTFRSELGLDDLDVTTTDEGATEVSAGSYISDNVYSEITADSEGRQQIDLNLDVSRNVTVRGRASNDGNTGVGIFFEKDY